MTEDAAPIALYIHRLYEDDLVDGERLTVLARPYILTVDGSDYWYLRVRRPQHHEEELLLPAHGWRTRMIAFHLRQLPASVTGRKKVGRWGTAVLLLAAEPGGVLL